MTISRLIAGLAMILVLAGCSTSTGGGPSSASAVPGSTAPGTSVVGVVPSQPAGSSAPNDFPAAALAPVVTDAAGRAGVTPDQVKVVSAEKVTFPDGSLGCPQPGIAYTQVVVDGFKVVLQANGMTYDYRGTGSEFKLCSQKPV